MSTGFRLQQGGRIDRNSEYRFNFDGQAMTGHAGDSLASALLANGIQFVARSFKYHRPRGIMSAALEEANALVTLGEGAHSLPNSVVTTEELHDGLTAHAQHCWPSLKVDFAAVNQVFASLLGAGFYYKTFMGPGRSPKNWLFYEHFIRRAAGLGKAAREPDPDQYETVNAFCDLLVIGSGPAGLEAARIAAEAGLDVILAERDFELGGALLTNTGTIDQQPAAQWLASRLGTLNKSANIRILKRTTAFGLYDGTVAGLVERRDPVKAATIPWRERFWIVRAKRIIIAAGAMERPLLFAGNDRPGIMLASAVGSYLNRWAVAPGRRIVLATTNDSAYATARDLAIAGLSVTLIDSRERVSETLHKLANNTGIDLRLGQAIRAALGGRHVRAVDIGPATGQGSITGRLACDIVAVSGGWSPTQHLLSQRGVKPSWNQTLQAFLPGRANEPIDCVGAAAGIWRSDDCARSGRAIAAAAAAALGRKAPVDDIPAPGGWETPIKPVRLASDLNLKKIFVDLQHDVTAADILQANQEGYEAPELLKRYTTLGMAADQGRTSAVPALALLSEMASRSVGEIGTTTFRPPFAPVSIGALAGAERDKHLLPIRRSPLHDVIADSGAHMLETGLWMRPWYYPQTGETVDEAYLREMRQTRDAVGLCDVSTLGKIAVQGPDAGEFLDRIYVNGFKAMKVGMARYGVMLREDGIVMDDGTSWRLSEHEYFMTTTTGNAAKVMAWLEDLLETRWPELRVSVSSVTDQWAGISVAGPRAREILPAHIGGLDFTNEAFPFMAVRTGVFNGVPCRLARISFSGELAYEVYIGASHGPALWHALRNMAKEHGGCAYGLEALGALRIEKGHVGGPELDGRTTLEDLGLGRMASTKKAFIGNILRQRPDLQRADRARLVGLVPVTKGETFKGGAILAEQGQEDGHGLGWVTSVTESPSLGHWIGLGFIQGGLDKWQGKTILAADPIRGRSTLVKIVAPHFLDPEGTRLHA
ncbi:sarcosine oxidase subunit alpha family protein [Dongia soli]|uniref:Sarcosine oxidase subunit alpha family protein n=1 Tax=Dongia soli TaxID=600628 RepID=A0ABU5EFZ9_9PROT|nr:sarcosine oxidase subunit alpha family protein [Dongia soli]MDY0885257.1 sarcosine oxidase subunit alpha family protein [Dongia soli]